jgi:hypothetical protein
LSKSAIRFWRSTTWLGCISSPRRRCSIRRRSGRGTWCRKSFTAS